MKTKLAICGIALAGFLYWQNNGLIVTALEYECKIPKAFDGYKILHVSDLQNKTYGKNHKTLIGKMTESEPDIIVFTGDLLDRNKTNVDTAMSFMEEAVKIAPVYYVSGNHEHQSGQWEELSLRLTETGVMVLDNGKSTIEKDGEQITLIGLADKSVNPYYESVLQTFGAALPGDEFTILLSHRPELFETYVAADMSLVFCGHAHGGQIRLPFIGGLFAPNQGFFPKYTTGMYIQDDTAMVVSRGLGNSVFPFRIFNRPELIEVVLTKQ